MIFVPDSNFGLFCFLVPCYLFFHDVQLIGRPTESKSPSDATRFFGVRGLSGEDYLGLLILVLDGNMGTTCWSREILSRQ